MDKDLLSYLYVILLPVSTTIVGFICYRKLEKPLRFLFYYIVLGAISEILNFILSSLHAGWKNMPLGNVYFMLSFLLLGLYFIQLYKGFINSKYLIGLIVCYELCFVINLVFIQGIHEYPSVLKGISDVCFIGLSLIYFHRTMLEGIVERLWQEPLVYANVAILLYFSGSLFYSLLFNRILTNNPDFTLITAIYFRVLNLMFYLMVAIGFWKAGKQKVAIKTD